MAFLASDRFFQGGEFCVRGDFREYGLLQEEVAAALQKRIREGSGLQRSEKSLLFEDATNTLLDGSGRGLLVPERLFVFGAPVICVKAFQLLFLGIELRCGGFRGLRRGNGNSYEQEKKKPSGSHICITSQDPNLGHVLIAMVVSPSHCCSGRFLGWSRRIRREEDLRAGKDRKSDLEFADEDGIHKTVEPSAPRTIVRFPGRA